MDNHTKKRLKKILAQEAVKIIVSQGIEKFGDAKNKAAKKLNTKSLGCLPSNYEIEKKLEEHYQLYTPKAHTDYIHEMREIAIEIMTILIDFQTYALGSVVNGTASSSSTINIHLASEDVYEVIQILDKCEMKYKFLEKKIKFNKKINKFFCGLSLLYKNMIIEITIFNHRDIRQCPLSRIDGKPIKRLKINSLKALL